MYETAEPILVDLTEKARYAEPGEKHVLFRLGNETFGLAAQIVRGVMGIGSLIPAANSSFLLIGFVFCQTKALPVFDIRTALGLPAPGLGGKEEVLVLSLPSDARLRIGILVESLENACAIHSAAIKGVVQNRIPPQFLRGSARLDEREVLVLDLDFLISPTALRRLSNLT